MKAIDKFWLFGVHPTHYDDQYLGRFRDPSGKKSFGSNITPAEGAYYLGLSNVVMAVAPPPYTSDADYLMFTFKPMNKVLWAVGASGGLNKIDNEFIVDLADKYDNVIGASLDDFNAMFGSYSEPEKTKKIQSTIMDIKNDLSKAKRPLEVNAVLYFFELKNVNPEAFKELDTISFWTWDSNDLVNLESNFEKACKMFPNQKKMLGIYLYDFRNYHPVPLDKMKHQCEVGLKLLKEGKVDGLIFEANSVMGAGFETDEWVRNWIIEVADTEVEG